MTDEIKDPLIGQTLGAYQLVGKLGQGGMATVYKAHEAALDRFVAVKILPPSFASDPALAQRFSREARAVAQLNHPNIVPIYSYGSENNLTYIAMQFVEGGALQHERGQAYKLEEALRLLYPIARALGYAHKRGIVHRDIKPGNILISEEGWPLLSDFGLAQMASDSVNLTQSGVGIGTPNYMSPEQAQGDKVDYRTDIYALGIMLYELATGEAPFRSDTPMGVLVKHITTPLPKPSQVNAQISEEVEHVILTAAAKKPDDRYQSAEEMADALEGALNESTHPSKSKPVAVLKSAPEVESNPFTFGNPIKEPSRFFGRKADIRQIVNRLLSSAHESTSIVGERRIGKTSILNYLSNAEVAASLGLSPDKFCLVYMDFQGLTDITPARFWQRVLGKVARVLPDPQVADSFKKASQQDGFDLFDLEDLFTEVVDRGLTIVLCMDEFEYVTQNPRFGSEFFGSLRALAIHNNLTLLPATRRELVDLCHSDEIKGSPFFNIFANVVLRPFTLEEVDDMLVSYASGGSINLSPDLRAFIHNIAGGYPIFVQIAGYYAWEALLQGMEREQLEKFVNENFRQQAEAHFNYTWTHCTESEKITLLVIHIMTSQKLSKKTIPNSENLAKIRARAPQDVSTLGKRGLVLEVEGKYVIFSPHFAQWVKQEILAAPGEEENEADTVEWLKTSGQQNVKDASKALPQFKKKYWHLVNGFMFEFAAKIPLEGAAELVKLL